MEFSVLCAPHFESELPICPRDRLILHHFSPYPGVPRPLATLSAMNCPHIYTNARRGTNGKPHNLGAEICGCVWVQADLQEARPFEVYRGQFKLSLYLHFRLILDSLVSFSRDQKMLRLEFTCYFELTVGHLSPIVPYIHPHSGEEVYVGFQDKKRSVGRLFI